MGDLTDHIKTARLIRKAAKLTLPATRTTFFHLQVNVDFLCVFSEFSVDMLAKYLVCRIYALAAESFDYFLNFSA